MKHTHLGEFEELVLLIIGSMKDDAYGINIKKELERQIKRNASIGALHSALIRLEKKGFIKSREGGATAERGGRRKRFYKLTTAGKYALEKVYYLRKNLIQLIPGIEI